MNDMKKHRPFVAKNVFVGVLLRVATYFMAWLLASIKIPEGIMEFFVAKGKLGIICLDLLSMALPFIAIFVLLSYLWFSVFTEKNIAKLILVISGWVILDIIIISGGKLSFSNWFSHWIDLYHNSLNWPHLPFIAFAPVIGICLGYLFAAKKRRLA